MKTHRDPAYTTLASTPEEIVNEIVFQKRVELWGEGQSFYDIKRLNIPVVRSYGGTNFYELCRFNTTTRPAWMNIVIVQREGDENEKVKRYNNPDPSGKYPVIP